MSSLIRSLLDRAWQRIGRFLGVPLDRVELVVSWFGAAHPDAFFVQIGANDGEAADPLRAQIERRQWAGVMVEPVPYVFRKLHARYAGHPRVRLEMSAVADRAGSMTFYHLREARPGEKVWPWYHALGSFRRDVILKHANAVPDMEARLVETQVPCVTFADLCARHGVGRIDLLQIDTEGYDYEILKTVDLARWRPRLVIYEHCHLSPADRAAARGQFDSLGYATFEQGFNTAALDCSRLGPADSWVARLFPTSSVRKHRR